MRDDDFCFVGIVDVDFILVRDCNVVCIRELWDAEERVALNSRHNVYILCWMVHVMLKFVHVACLLHFTIGHAEGLVRLASCCDKRISLPVSFCPDGQCPSAVGYGRGDGSVQDSLFKFVDFIDLFYGVIILLVNLASRRGIVG